MDRLVQITDKSENAEPMPVFLFSYRFEGAFWGLEVPAMSEQEARHRLAEAAAGCCDGILCNKVSHRLAWCAPVVVWCQDAWRWLWRDEPPAVEPHRL